MFDVDRIGSLSFVVMPRRMNVTHLRALLDCVQRELADGPSGIVLDLRDTDAIDMAALAGIVDIYKQSAKRGVALRLGGPRASVRRLLAITRLDRIFPVTDELASDELAAAAE
jgi:anti-anti-sigma factor